MELAIFRIVQECLTNVHRHSGAKIATIRVFRDTDVVQLEVRDQGKGIPQESLEKFGCEALVSVYEGSESGLHNSKVK